MMGTRRWTATFWRIVTLTLCIFADNINGEQFWHGEVLWPTFNLTNLCSSRSHHHALHNALISAWTCARLGIAQFHQASEISSAASASSYIMEHHRRFQPVCSLVKPRSCHHSIWTHVQNARGAVPRSPFEARMHPPLSIFVAFRVLVRL